MPRPNVKSSPTMAEFSAFHGMRCNPLSSQRCIDYFNGGALFASQTDYDVPGDSSRNLASFDFTRTPIGLNLITYYLLVIFSGTGLLSLVGQTNACLIREENISFKNATSISTVDGEKPSVRSLNLCNIPGAKSLVIPQKVIKYIVDRSNQLGPCEGKDETSPPASSDVRFIRRFEFQFGTLLSVIMCHFECRHGRHYLVEVYEFGRHDSIFTRAISSVMSAARGLLDALERISASNKIP